jgi:hypothetical protein
MLLTVLPVSDFPSYQHQHYPRKRKRHFSFLFKVAEVDLCLPVWYFCRIGDVARSGDYISKEGKETSRSGCPEIGNQFAQTSEYIRVFAHVHDNQKLEIYYHGKCIKKQIEINYVADFLSIFLHANLQNELRSTMAYDMHAAKIPDCLHGHLRTYFREGQ